MLTNKKLSDCLGIPLFKIRRWTKELLPPDPKATRRSGHARELSFNDCFFVYLGGFLITKYNHVFYEVRNILEQLMPYLLKIGLMPEIPDYARREGIEKKILSFHEIEIYEFREKLGKFYIKLRGPIKRVVSREVDSSGRSYAHIKTEEVEYWIVPPPQSLLDKWCNESDQMDKELKLNTDTVDNTDQLGWMDQSRVERSSELPIYSLLQAFFLRVSERESLESFWEWERKFWTL